MSDCGSDSMTLKEYVRKGRCSIETAQKIGKEVGDFVGRLHLWGKDNPDVCEFFNANQQAKALSSWVFYGRLLSTLDDDDLEILQDPKVALSEEEKRALERIAEESGQAMRKITGTVRILGGVFFGSCLMTLGVGHG